MIKESEGFTAASELVLKGIRGLGLLSRTR